MIITVGSKNPQKVLAVKEVLEDYFKEEEQLSFVGLEVPSGISEQPMSFKEMFTGAENRAKGAFQKDFSVGLESGIQYLDEMDYTNFCACVIYDGEKIYKGISPGFIFPKKFIDEIKKNDVDMSQALYNLGITKEKRIGYTDGYVGLMTRGQSNRKEYMKQAVHMAMIDYNSKKINFLSTKS